MNRDMDEEGFHCANGTLDPAFGGSGQPTNASFNDEDLGYTLDLDHPENGLLVPAPKTGADGMLPVRAADKLEPTSPGANIFNKTDRTFPVFIEDIRMITSMINIGLVNKSRARSADQRSRLELSSDLKRQIECILYQ